MRKIIGLSLFSIFIYWTCDAVNVKDFGAKGDGKHDDTKAIMVAVQQAGDGVVQFPRGSYRITETIEIILAQSGRIGLTGVGGTASIIMEGAGAAISITGSHKGTSNPESVANEIWQSERMPVISELEIIGNHISNQTANIQMENVRGISITGNTFVRGYDRHIVTENSQNIIIGSNVFDHNDDYFPPQIEAKGGILMKKIKNVILSDNIIQGAEHAGAIELYDAQEISVSNCQIINYLYQGISINECSHVNINGCLISTEKKGEGPALPAGIYLTGDCQYVSIQNNIFDVYLKNGIVNNAKNKISKKFNTFIYNDLK